MSRTTSRSLSARGALAAQAVAAGAIIGLAALAAPAAGSVEYASKILRAPIVVGNDDDNPSNPIIQPEGVAANQSLRNSDLLIGNRRDDVLIGRQGPDVLLGYGGSDVMVGGLERGSDVAEFPNFDTAHGGAGDDFFIWAPGDGSDAFVGGEGPQWYWKKVTRTVRRGGERVRVTKRVKRRRADEDRLLVGVAVPSTAGDNSTPRLFRTKGFGKLPRVNISGAGAGATTGDSPAQPVVLGFCEVVRAPRGLGYSHLVRFFREDNGAQAVTIRVKQVESVYCRTRGSNTITEFDLGAKGNSEVEVETTDFRAERGSKLAALLADDDAANGRSARANPTGPPPETTDAQTSSGSDPRYGG